MTTRELSQDIHAVQDIQRALVVAGILDPVFRFNEKMQEIDIIKSDGVLGPNTEAAMRMAGWNEDFAWALNAFIQQVEDTLKPKRSPDGLVTCSIVNAMQDAGYFLCTLPGAANIVYLEGVSATPANNADGYIFQANDNKPDEWNDLRIVISMVDGAFKIISCHAATTGPGMYYTVTPMNRYGAARIQFGQYKAWKIGIHQGTQPALQHCDAIIVCRDLNKDFERQGDLIYPSYSTINQHSTSINYVPSRVGKWSAGCLVGQRFSEHLNFIATCMSDPRFLNNQSYKFISTVMPWRQINEYI